MVKEFLRGLKSQGVTQKQIAEQTGLVQSFISHLSNGGNCSLETAIKLADVFHVPLDTVINRKSPESNFTDVEELLLKTTSGNDDIARAALRSAQGEKLIKELEGEGRRAKKVVNG